MKAKERGIAKTEEKTQNFPRSLLSYLLEAKKHQSAVKMATKSGDFREAEIWTPQPPKKVLISKKLARISAKCRNQTGGETGNLRKSHS